MTTREVIRYYGAQLVTPHRDSAWKEMADRSRTVQAEDCRRQDGVQAEAREDVGHCGVVVDGETMKGPTLKKIMNTTDVPTTLIRQIVRFVLLPENIRPVEFTGARHE